MISSSRVTRNEPRGAWVTLRIVEDGVVAWLGPVGEQGVCGVVLGQGDCKQSASGAVGPALGGAEAGVDDGGRAVDDGGAAAIEGDRQTCQKSHVANHTSHQT